MIVVGGGRANHPDDRSTAVADLRPLVRWDPSSAGFVAVPALVVGDRLSMSNLVQTPGRVWASSGPDLWTLDADGPPVRSQVPDLVDVHELTADGATVLVANTGRDEMVVLDADGSCLDRVAIPGGRHHLNQVHVTPDRARWGLVHHVDGRQFRRRVAGRLLKRQGDGGVIRFGDGDGGVAERVPLRLTAPHSLRTVGDETWVLDSGRGRLVRFDRRWRTLGELPIGGWGRGAALDGDHLWVGVSPVRPRYEGLVEGPAVSRPTVVVIDVISRSIVERRTVPGMDQINGVHLVDDSWARR